jgi:hypothetical protein
VPRQPLFPRRYETWLSRRNGREVVVIGYDEELGEVEYTYLGGSSVCRTMSDTWTNRFVFLRSPQGARRPFAWMNPFGTIERGLTDLCEDGCSLMRWS